jgi:hypothetical protein
MVTLADGQGRARGVAVDDLYVYWTDGDQGSVKRVAKAGGSTSVLVSDQDSPSGIVVDATHMYWLLLGAPATLSGGNFVVHGRLMRALKDGSSPEALGVALWVPGALGSSTPLAMDDAAVYWMAAWLAPPTRTTSGVDARIFRFDKTTGAISFVADANDLEVWGLAVDSTQVYWTTLSGSIRVAPLLGGTTTAVVVREDLQRLCPPMGGHSGSIVGGIAARNGTIYWADYACNGVFSVTVR